MTYNEVYWQRRLIAQMPAIRIQLFREFH